MILFIKIMGGTLDLSIAKLGTVYDQAGKARIVGITNYWVQLALYPIHKAVLSILESVPMDGTYNQTAPIKRLLNRLPEFDVHMYHSFDLSSATDRLPVDIQADILNILNPKLGSYWKDLLGSLQWKWRSLNKRVSIKEIQYSVGQPMGAYSSWAMLALSHHVIVQCAAINVGERFFTAYAVLGDDIVIANDTVAAEYLKLMNSLGVDINLTKSLKSKDFAEFAKRWLGPENLDLSPIGPGLLLRSIRSRQYMSALISQMFTLGLLPDLQATLASIQSLPTHYRGQRWNALWAAFGLNSFVLRGSHAGGYNFLQLVTWCFSIPEEDLTSMLTVLRSAIAANIVSNNMKAKVNLEDAIKYFSHNWLNTMTARGWPNRMLEFLLKIFGPGWWIYVSNFSEKRDALNQELRAFDKKVSEGQTPLDKLILAISSDPYSVNVQNIDWKDREMVKKQIEYGKAITQRVQAQYDDLITAPLPGDNKNRPIATWVHFNDGGPLPIPNQKGKGRRDPFDDDW